MNKIQAKRLRKLISFLKELPREKFYFGSEVKECKSNGKTCATVACAIGWTPKLFSGLVKWGFRNSVLVRGEIIFDEFIMGERRLNFSGVAEQLFGVPIGHGIFSPFDQHSAHKDLPICENKASPKEVAKMLEKYMRLCTEHKP